MRGRTIAGQYFLKWQRFCLEFPLWIGNVGGFSGVLEKIKGGHFVILFNQIMIYFRPSKAKRAQYSRAMRPLC